MGLAGSVLGINSEVKENVGFVLIFIVIIIMIMAVVIIISYLVANRNKEKRISRGNIDRFKI
jgi:ABC-type Na+ efflux pump permease subunit